MTIAEIQQEIMRMKKEQDVCILAHAYQGQEILEVADYMGDSYGLSVQASKSNCKGVIMCGVRFMAETCKVLSPDKKVWLANPLAGCPMAEQLDLEGLRELKAKYPDYAVVAYINTTSELKTECDVCVTSSSAVQICSRLDNDKIWAVMWQSSCRRKHLPFITADVQDILLSAPKMWRKRARPIRMHCFWCIRNAVRKWLNRPIMSDPQQIL